MKIEDFVKEANKVANDSIREKRINSMLNTKPYVGIKQKMDLAEKVITISTHVYDKADNIVGIRIKSFSKYIIHLVRMIEMYTDLEFDNDTILDQYDLLNRNGFIELILNQIGEKEIAENQMCLDMAWNDFLQNELSLQSFVQGQVQRFGDITGATLSPLLSSLTKTISELDAEKIKQIVDVVENK